MASKFLNDLATLITSALWSLYNTLSAASLVLDAAPTGSFRCVVTVSASGTHTTCSGHVYINDEDLNFPAAGKKISKTFLTSKPTITTSGLDCWILITCVSTGGADLYKETNTTIDVDWEDSITNYPDGMGGFSRSDSNCETDYLTAKVGDKVTYDGKTLLIKNIKNGEMTLGGIVLTKILQF
jgi:hypothetical protein